MRLTSFEHEGRASFGALTDAGVIDLGARMKGRYDSLKALLHGGLDEARQLTASASADLDPATISFLPVIPEPGKIWCAGLNYGEHVKETGREITDKPMFFLRFADSQVGHLQAIQRPLESSRLDFEGEIAIVIGRFGFCITEARAWEHIAGYACYNDASVRDWQNHTSQWCPGKNFYRTGAFGPHLVTADEIPAGTTMTLSTRLNGTEVQRATTDLMLHDIPRLIAYASTVAPLRPGDVIVTGTPGGIGAKRQPPLWMQHGDVVEVEVDRIGVLRNTVADRTLDSVR
jgi:2-keto-4-pentenoate hydratase/2-oxohepta-3-ene-1,7-dioic acid hydratase in catechol pathway